MVVAFASPKFWLGILARRNPAMLAALAYIGYSLAGALVLTLPVMRDVARTEPLGFVDALFTSASAVSTTGLVTLDPASTFSLAGEIIILFLIQIGGLGYMTLMSFAYIILRDRLSPVQTRLTRSSFGLPSNIEMASFVWRATVFTLAIEAVGALFLWRLFRNAGTPDALWNGIFHSVSAFCTAGFARFPTSFEAYSDNGAMLMVLAVLSYLGALGFVVLVETFEAVAIRPRRLSVTTRLTLQMSFWLAAAATLFFLIFEPSIRSLPVASQLSNAFFQAMTASTTVGFNSVPVGGLAPAAIMVVYLLMFVGASPAGTGGGLKSTTAAVLAATVLASLRGWRKIALGRYVLPEQRVLQAMATLVIALFVIFAAVVMLDLTGSYAFDKALFEVISALGTVGLSMGLTAELNDAGKLIIVVVMLIGRIGILTFFISLATANAATEPEIMPKRDVIL
ncbi:MAG: potassium transporter KtrB [Rhizobiales bacterium]|nr:potassium transporter KtrB [Hyphomicrobiales bacterium]